MPGGRLAHADHVRLAWASLRRGSTPAALSRMARGLRALAAAAGRPELYHETITVACVLLVGDRMRSCGAGSWEEFAAANGDLLEWPRMRRLVDEEFGMDVLRDDPARAHFVLPVPRTHPAPDGTRDARP